MRFSEQQIQIIREETLRAFGQGTEVRLFGSRIDDTQRGGDIDLHIETELMRDEASKAADQLYVALIKRLGDQKIDIITHTRGAPLRAIDEIAMQTGIQI